DAQSALDALDDLAGHGLDFTKQSLATARSRIEELKEAAETTTLTADMRLRLTQALDQALAAVEQWPLHQLTFPDVARCLTRGYRAAREALPQDWAEATGEDLHELRKRIVTHRYQMETVVPLWRRFGKMWVGEAQRLRDRLSQQQDLLLLVKMTEPHQPLARWRSRLRPAIIERGNEHLRAARRIAERLFVERPRAFRRRLEVMWETGGRKSGLTRRGRDERRTLLRHARHDLAPRLAAALAPHARARIPGAHVAVVKPVPDAGMAVGHHDPGRPPERARQVRGGVADG